MTATVEPVQDALNRAPAPLILPLFGAALCVLVIACANAAALQLARGLRRYPEMAIHAALGASRVRLAGQALIEHAIVGLLGGAIGTALAYVTLSTLVASTLDRIAWTLTTRYSTRRRSPPADRWHPFRASTLSFSTCVCSHSASRPAC